MTVSESRWQEVQLTPTEYEVLAYQAMNAGTVLTSPIASCCTAG
jgi:hypothetical protein